MEKEKCGTCGYSFPRTRHDIEWYGDPHKFLECTATDKKINIYKDNDDVCDKGKYMKRGKDNKWAN